VRPPGIPPEGALTGPFIGTKEFAMKRPDITLTRRDLGDLDALLGAASIERLGRVGEYLLDELTRARIVDDNAASATLVTMGATLRFRDEDNGRVTEATLVYPREAGARDNAVSVLTPVGAALLGLSKGQSIEYETHDGRRKHLTVLEVVPPRA
jgi:regulator of nucleoside diphosphate kinase